MAVARRTIFALSSAAGKAGVAVIRVSGPDAHTATQAMLQGGRLPRTARTAEVRLLQCPETGDRLDRALVLHFDAPRSFTGENVVELHVHGGNATVRSVLAALGRRSELRPAGPGDFTRQSLLNHKLDLVQVEGLADLIQAETKEQQQQALRGVEGEHSAVYDEWRRRLIGGMAHVEALIDFGEDEGIEADVLPQAIAEIRALRDTMWTHLSRQHCGERVRAGVRVAIVGRPNVGKSSLLNRLCRRQIAIVTTVPGTTRDVLETMLDLDGLPVVLQDTAGVRHGPAVCEVEQEGVRRALAATVAADLRVCVQVLASDARCTQAGGSETCTCNNAGATVVCFNKCDLAPVAASISALAPLAGPLDGVAGDCAHVSCLTGEGWEAFVALLARHVQRLCGLDGAYTGGPFVTHARHRAHLEHCVAALDAALAHENDIVILAEELRVASLSLAAITGKIHVEDVLDVIFASFCIGK